MELTLETLKAYAENNGNYEAIEYAKTFKGEYPKKPSKPILKTEFTSTQMMDYAIKLAEYENLMIEYSRQRALFSEKEWAVDSLIEDFIKDVSGFFNIPEKYQNKIWVKAWQYGHSEGYWCVLSYLEDLVDIFKD